MVSNLTANYWNFFWIFVIGNRNLKKKLKGTVVKIFQKLREVLCRQARTTKKPKYFISTWTAKYHSNHPEPSKNFYLIIICVEERCNLILHSDVTIHLKHFVCHHRKNNLAERISTNTSIRKHVIKNVITIEIKRLIIGFPALTNSLQKSFLKSTNRSLLNVWGATSNVTSRARDCLLLGKRLLLRRPLWETMRRFSLLERLEGMLFYPKPLFVLWHNTLITPNLY